MANYEAARERFEAKYIPEPNSGCWLWFGANNKQGYGTFWCDGKSHKAHRVSYQLERGDLQPHLDLLHRCDNPCCVNPEHLKQGTTRDNVLDMWAKNRGTRSVGERNGNSRLLRAGVERIRDMAELGYEFSYIAQRVGIERSMVGRIVSGKAWRE